MPLIDRCRWVQSANRYYDEAILMGSATWRTGGSARMRSKLSLLIAPHQPLI
jgi:hypothetical protein